ncbi:MAG: hypothetical protein HC815_05975 [Richelia sp. RM1_1_1]|nr:hypothetical protein [Richelia sp. RM1_1_1]
MTLAKEQNITKLSLGELSIDSSRLWEQIEAAQHEDSDENQVGLIIEQLIQNQNAIESKIDSIVWVKEMLESELAAWRQRRDRALMLYSDAIKAREDSITQIKEMLLHLHESGLILQRSIGRECEIEIRDNPPSVAQLNIDIESEEFPSEFKRVKIFPDNQTIINAYKAGIDVSKYAEIKIGKQVRFKRKKSKNK